MIAWLHTEMGYTIVGPASFYRLTMAEIRMLQRGYEVIHREKKGKKGKGRRKSDDKKLAKFNKRRGIT